MDSASNDLDENGSKRLELIISFDRPSNAKKRCIENFEFKLTVQRLNSNSFSTIDF